MVDFTSYRVQDLKNFLIYKEYDEEDMQGKRKVDLVEFIKEEGLEKEFELFTINDDGEPALANATLDEEINLLPATHSVRNVVIPVQPLRGTKEWNDYIMGLFNDDEKVDYTTADGKKIEAVRADGLRRVGETALGKVLFSGPVEQEITYTEKGLPRAWVKYKIVVRGHDGVVVEYSSLGDVSYLNTDNMFLAFALLTAETRAKGRAWREALGVKTYAVEEFSGSKNTATVVEEITTADWKEESVTTAQIRSIKNMCSKLKIDVHKVLNMNSSLKFDGKKIRYDSLEDEDFTNKSAAILLSILNEMQQGTKPVDESIKLSN